MERCSLLIPSNLDTVKHLEIGIWLIPDMETEGTLLRSELRDPCVKGWVIFSATNNIESA